MARGGDEPTPGLLLVDKPAGFTSHDVVAKARRLLSTRKVGHAGTLDPMATGLLVLGVGKATRLLTYVVGHDKAYEATIRLGESTVTDDAEGDVTATFDASGITDEAIAAAVAALTGDILQAPSAVSAIKVNGERAYARVRAGEDVELPARPVTVARFAVIATRRIGAAIELDVEVEVSSGTYVRALARDLGAALGVGGHLTALRRTRVGRFDVTDAATLAALEDAAARGERPARLGLDEAAAGALPELHVTDQEAAELGHGRSLPVRGRELGHPRHPDDTLHDAVAVTAAGTAVAVVRRRGDAAQPVIVFAGPAHP